MEVARFIGIKSIRSRLASDRCKRSLNRGQVSLGGFQIACVDRRGRCLHEHYQPILLFRMHRFLGGPFAFSRRRRFPCRGSSLSRQSGFFSSANSFRHTVHLVRRTAALFVATMRILACWHSELHALVSLYERPLQYEVLNSARPEKRTSTLPFAYGRIRDRHPRRPRA